MSFFTIANYLQKEAKDNEHLQTLMQTVAEKIEKNEKLKNAERAIYKEQCHLQMELFTLKSIAEQRTEEREMQKTIETASFNACSSYMGLLEQLKKVNWQKMMNSDLQAQELQMQVEMQKMEEEYKEKLQIYEAMENRNIVQKLRQTQRKYAEELKKLEEVKAEAAAREAEANKKVEAAKHLRNQKVVKLVQSTKQLQEMREELKMLQHEVQIAKMQTLEVERLEKKKVELTLKLQEKNKQLAEKSTKALEPHSQQGSASSINFDTNKVSNLFKSFKFDPQNVLKINDILLTSLSQKPENDSLCSILRSGNATSTTPSKHVHFLLPSNSSNNSDDNNYAATSPMGSPDITAETNSIIVEKSGNTVTKPCTNTKKSGDETFAIDLTTPNQTLSPSPEILSNNAVELQTKSRIDTIKKVDKVKSPIEILEYRVVKPAGTALPKVIPYELSPEAITIASTSSGVPTNSTVQAIDPRRRDDFLNFPYPGAKPPSVAEHFGAPRPSAHNQTFANLMDALNLTEDEDNEQNFLGSDMALKFDSDMADGGNESDKFSIDLSDGDSQRDRNSDNFL